MNRRLTAVLFGAAILVSASAAAAQDLAATQPLGGAIAGLAPDSLTGRSLLLFAAITVLSLAPGLAVMVTCFPFIVTVLSILRQAIGLQQAPPNMLIVSLALFLTWFVMDPVLTEAWRVAADPLLQGTISPTEAFAKGIVPFRGFMQGRVDPDTLAHIASLRVGAPIDPPPLQVLIPSFILSEISRAFQIGFMVYLPFLIIDLVVSAVLMAMGMMMVPPAVVALPFKLAFFVVADGWTLVSTALVRSYTGG